MKIRSSAQCCVNRLHTIHNSGAGLFRSPKFLLRTIKIALSLGLLVCSGILADAAPQNRRHLDNSVRELSGRHVQKVEALKAEHLGEVIEFSVALQMRDFPKLLARLQAGEKVTRAELEEKYLPTPEEYAAVAGWVKSQGLKITQRDDRSRLGVFVRGTVAQVQEALTVQFAKVTTEEGTFTSAAAAPSVPEELAEVILGVNGLQPHNHARKHSTFHPLTGNAPPYLVREILGAYNAASTGYTGAGEKIAILIDTFPANNDLTAFWSNNGIPQSLTNIEKVSVIGGTLPAPSGEETLDVEWTSGIAPGAKIRIYASKDLSDVNLNRSIQRIIDDLPTQPSLHQLSISLGSGETSTPNSQLQTDAQYFATLAAAGVSIFVSSGDSGSNEGGILQPSYYASDPSVTAVGGTVLRLNTSGGTVRTETGWTGSGGGISHYFTRPAWQVGAGVPAGNKRVIPDVSCAASPATGAYVYLRGSVQQIGGTSWSAPTWAGFCALINQARTQGGQGALGLLNPRIYPLLGTSNFRDITAGNNGAYAAAASYDLVTGLGSPNVGVLLQTLAGTSSAAPAITGFTPASGLAGTQVTISGVNLNGATAVRFNGLDAATFNVLSSSQIAATVPVNALTGPISVVTAQGSAISGVNFTVASAPTNDSFAGATLLNGASGTATSGNAGMTKEPGEPNHAGNAGGKSIWFVWVAPAAGSCMIDTFGSNFDTLLAVYTGTSVDALTEVASNDDSGTSTTSSVTFTAAAGTVYHIAVDGYSGASGSVTLNWAQSSASVPTIASFTPATGAVGASVTINGANFSGATSVNFNGVSATFTVVSAAQISTAVPAGATTGPVSVTTPVGTTASTTNFIVSQTTSNDSFVNAQPIPPTGGMVVGSNVGATKEAGEPNHAGNAGGKSVWWTWTAPVSGFYTISTAGSSFDTVLAVYTGNRVDSLMWIAANDDASAYTLTSRVRFNAVAGTIYRIAVDGYGGATGSIALNIAAR